MYDYTVLRINTSVVESYVNTAWGYFSIGFIRV